MSTQDFTYVVITIDKFRLKIITVRKMDDITVAGKKFSETEFLNVFSTVSWRLETL